LFTSATATPSDRKTVSIVVFFQFGDGGKALTGSALTVKAIIGRKTKDNVIANLLRGIGYIPHIY
jgi:hypothetical protein